MLTVEEIMTPNPERAESSESIADVLGKLLELDVRHLPITERGELVGMISDRDMRGFTTPLTTTMGNTNSSNRRLDAPVSTLMNGDVISVTPDTEVSDVIDLMIDHKIGAVPVVDGVSGALMGIVSYIDVIRSARDLF